MTEQQITRSINIVVGSVEENSYGDMLFTDKGGNNYKIGNKRVQFFRDVIIEGNAVQLNYTTGYGKEYIYNAKSIGDMLPPPTTPQPVETRDNPPPVKFSGEEQGMWFKEIGECWRGGFLTEEQPVERKLIGKYKTRMCHVMGIEAKFEKGG